MLFRRKKKFQQGEGCPFVWFDNWLIQDFDEEVGLFNCTVEVSLIETSLIHFMTYFTGPSCRSYFCRRAISLCHRLHVQS